jgi:hypothetical protein
MDNFDLRKYISKNRLLENNSTPKAIIMAGGAAVGKSTALRTINSELKSYKNLNADTYVEDKDSPMYKNLSAASAQIRKVDLPQTISNKENLIYDTTASNLKTLQPILDDLKSNGYDIMMIMVYAHPIVSFLRNFKRERKVPAVGVLGTWSSVYNLINDYKKIFGDNFILIKTPSSPEEDSSIKEFESAYEKGKLKEYFQQLLATGEFTSSFRKDDSDITLSPEELEKKEKAKRKSQEILEKSIEKISDMFDKVQNDLEQYAVDIKDLPNILKSFTNK